MERFDTSVLRGETEAVGVIEAWRTLFERTPGARLQHDPDWVLDEARAAADEGGELLLAALWRSEASGEEGELVGIAPVLARPSVWSCDLGYKPLARFPVVLGALLAPRPLVRADVRGAEEAMAGALGAALGACDLIAVESMPLDSPLAARLLGASPRLPFWVQRAAPDSPHRVIRMPGSFDEYLGKFKGRMRRQFAYRQRRLEALAREAGGELRVERVEKPEDVGRFLERAGDVSRRGWKGRRLGKVVGEKTHAARLLAAARAGRLRSYLMSLGERPVAFAIGSQAQSVYHYEHPAYDPELAAYSPGNVLLYAMLEDLFAHRKPELFDFGRGDNEYKRLFSNDVYDEAHLFLVRRSLYTGVAMVAHGAVSSLSRVAKEALERTELRETVRHLLRGRGDGAGPAAEAA